MKSYLCQLVAICLLPALVSCGGGSGGPDQNATFSIAGSVSGLRAGSTLILASSTATDAAWQTTAIKDNGTFTLAMPVKANGSYAVSVGTQPIGQTCSVVNGSGAGVVANVSNLSILCSDFPFKIGGSVSGLAAGSSFTIENNKSDLTTITSNGPFQFASPIAQNGSYAVTLASQPIKQTCTVNLGTGSGLSSNVNNVLIVCSDPSFKVSGSVLGLDPTDQVTLFNNLSDATTVKGSDPPNVGNNSFAFKTGVASNGSYTVTVATQPLEKICTVLNARGAGVIADVSNISVVCSPSSLSVETKVAGLAATGDSLTLLNNGGDALTVTTNGAYQFKVAYGGSYAVTVATQPKGKICTVGRGSGQAVTSPVTGTSVVCSNSTLTVAGLVKGLAAGKQVTLFNNASDPITVNSNGSFRFQVPIAYGGSYSVVVGTQPIGQNCNVKNGSATDDKGLPIPVLANVTNVEVDCQEKRPSIKGSVVGLKSGNEVVLTNNGGDLLKVPSDGPVSWSIQYGGSYSINVAQQPKDQICTVSRGTGAGVIDDVNNLAILCR